MNESPDTTEHPDCCGDFMTVDGNVLRCEVCLRCQEIEMEPEPDYDPAEHELPDDHQP